MCRRLGFDIQQNPRKRGGHELDKQGESVMKNLVGRIVTSLLLSVLTLGSVAQAQRSEQIIKANIPFDFAVGSRFFPAGHYSLVRSQPWQLELRDSGGRVLVNVLTQSVQASTTPDRPKLVFESEDRRHVLTQVWQENESIGQQILQSKWGSDAVRKRFRTRPNCRGRAIHARHSTTAITQGGLNEDRNERKQWTIAGG